jgi:hypothetical protein
VNTSLLEQELAPLNARIEQTRGGLEILEGELREVEAELESYAGDRQRFEAVQEICTALERLTELGADDLFWEGAGIDAAADHLTRVRGRVARFEEEIRGVRERREALKAQSERHLDELDFLYEEVREAHGREERRQEEFVVEREISPFPPRLQIMPWTTDGESERQFRRSLLIALLWALLFGGLIPLVHVPIPDRASVVPEIPERLAMLVKKELPKPPVPERPKEEKKPDQDKEPEKPQKTAKDEEHRGSERPEPKAAPLGDGAKVARKKAESTGVLAFKSSFKDLMDEVPVAKLGTEAHLSKKAPVAAGQAVPTRSLVAMQAQGGASGGIANIGVSRNLGSGGGGGGGAGTVRGIGGVAFTRVESAVAGLQEANRPLSDGPGPGRTDEEIQIVFDRYKAALYRIYNTELRKDPTLRGKMLLRLIIEPDGTVSLCKVESTDLASPELVAKITERVMRFNFGAKEDVPKTVILYPIDFLPAG